MLLRELMNSNSAELGNWGSSGITLNSTGSETPERVESTNVKQIKVNFAPGAEMKEAVEKHVSNGWKR